MIGKSSYNVLAQFLVEIYDEYEIARKLTVTITDNGSNFVKVFNCFEAMRVCEKNVQAINTVKKFIGVHQS